MTLNEGLLPGDLRPLLVDTVKEVHELRAELIGQRDDGGKHER